MIGEVVNTIVYPIKGMRGFEMKTRGIRTSTRMGVVGDRQFAVYRRSTGAPTEWKPKGQFHVCQNLQGMAKAVGTVGFLESDLDENYTLDPVWVDGILRGHGLPMDESTLVHTNSEYHQADTNKPCVSFLNLASVRWLEEQTGETIDPHRFRMNVWVEGLEPWAELGYVTAWQQGENFPMWVGDVQVHCDDICERQCHTSHLNVVSVL